MNNYNENNNLLSAVKANNKEQVKALLEAKADVNIQNESLETPLHLAVMNGDPDLVEIIAYYNNPSIMNDIDGKNPLYYAIDKENLSAVEILMDIMDGEYITFAIKKGNTSIVRDLVSFGGCLEKKENGYTPLQIAVLENNKEMIYTLLSCRANPNVKDNEGNTILHKYIKENDRKLASMILFWSKTLEQKDWEIASDEIKKDIISSCFNYHVPTKRLYVEKIYIEYINRIIECKECPICYEQITKRHVLPCLHVFCRNCIFKSETHNIHNCPLCREEM